jgi:hypothetical protein
LLGSLEGSGSKLNPTDEADFTEVVFKPTVYGLSGRGLPFLFLVMSLSGSQKQSLYYFAGHLLTAPAPPQPHCFEELPSPYGSLF